MMRNDYHQPDIDGSEPDEDYEYCEVCGHELEYEDCQQCGGEGGRYPAEDLPLEYDPSEWEQCEMCGGTGVLEWCSNVENHFKYLIKEPRE